jgi:ribosome-associated protein YbcJ (S4-like RNA binding protein)
VTHGKTGETHQFTASKRGLVEDKTLTDQLLVPTVGKFAAFGSCTIATAFGVEHPLLDQFIKQTGVSSSGSPSYAIVSITSSAVESVRSSFYSGVTLEAVQQRAQVYNGLTLRITALRAYLAGAFDDVDSVTHAKTGETHQFKASKRLLVGGKTVTGHVLVPTVDEFAAFGRCTIATAFAVEHPLLDQFIKQAGITGTGSRYTIVSTSARAVKPCRTATSAKRGRGKSTATAPTHGLMTPLLLPPATQPAKHAKLVVPPGHHPHPCATY